MTADRQLKSDREGSIDHLLRLASLTGGRGNAIAGHRRIKDLRDRLELDPLFQARRPSHGIKGDFFQDFVQHRSARGAARQVVVAEHGCHGFRDGFATKLVALQRIKLSAPRPLHP